MTNRFARIGETLAQFKERRKAETLNAYERKVVKRILTGLGLDRVSLAAEKLEVVPDDEEALMTMAWLRASYPSFPVILQTRETWVPDIRDFFKVRSRKNSFWAVWEDLTECLDGNSKPIGCVFPFPQVSDLGHGILHNASLPFSVYTDDRATEYIRMQRDGLGESPVVLELLDSFILRLSSVWSPV
jgi:hypothetical protein